MQQHTQYEFPFGYPTPQHEVSDTQPELPEVYPSTVVGSINLACKVDLELIMIYLGEIFHQCEEYYTSAQAWEILGFLIRLHYFPGGQDNTPLVKQELHQISIDHFDNKLDVEQTLLEFHMVIDEIHPVMRELLNRCHTTGYYINNVLVQDMLYDNGADLYIVCNCLPLHYLNTEVSL